MAEVTQESRKKGIAITAILALAAMKPTNKTELAIAGGITVIALAALVAQTILDRQKNNNKVVDKP